MNNRIIESRDLIDSIVLIGNYLPRKCGIATFTTDLQTALAEEAPNTACWTVAVNDIAGGYPYPPAVRFEINQNRISDYHLASDFLNMNGIDVACLQHEYGIFGGKHGMHILEFLRNLRMPLVTTLHTVLEEPSSGQREILVELGKLSNRLVVMSERAVWMLRDIYKIPEEKIAHIHHGIPDVPFIDPNYYKDQFGVEGRKVILTFGLLSPGKGIEYMIDALPAIVLKYPETVYIVLGATHPNVKREQGENYRISLQRRAQELDIGHNIIFHNRFLELDRLCEFLGAADIYVTPYLERKQIVSGTLAYALGTGKATISTPYWYAEEMLADGRGIIVPFRDSGALSEYIIGLINREAELHAMRKRAYMYCRQMIWKEVARSYLEIFADVRKKNRKKTVRVLKEESADPLQRDLPDLRLDHLYRLTDDTGMLQHAKFIIPNRFHGYCTDDNARALIVVMASQNMVPENDLLDTFAVRYLGFLDYAFNDSAGRFRNFMTYDRKWIEDVGSEDSHARAVWGLGTAIGISESESLTAMILKLFEKALPGMKSFESPRAWAFGLIGINAYLGRFSGDSEARRMRAHLSDKLYSLYSQNAKDDWYWIEDVLTYANAKIPHALIISGHRMQRQEMFEAGLRMLKWLVEIQKDPAGHFVPVGNRGWYHRNGRKAHYDQQPVEAHATIEACLAAHGITGDDIWVEEAWRAFDWFLGKNDLQSPLYDYKTKGCCDGLQPTGVNQNQGAESLLAWLLSLLSMNTLLISKNIGEPGKPTPEWVSGNGEVNSAFNEKKV